MWDGMDAKSRSSSEAHHLRSIFNPIYEDFQFTNEDGGLSPPALQREQTERQYADNRLPRFRSLTKENVQSSDDVLDPPYSWKQLGIDFVGALIAVVLVCANCVAFAYSVYANNDQLMNNLSTGINMTIGGVVAAGVLMPFISNVPWVIAGPDPFCIAFLAPMLQNIYEALNAQASGDEGVDFNQFLNSCITAIVISTMVCGFGMMLSSWKILRVADFIPYPVMCGLFTGLGLRLLQMGILICTKNFVGPNQLYCAISFGIIDAILRHNDMTWANVMVFILTPFAFHFCIYWLGISWTTAVASSWLFKPADVQMKHYSAWGQLITTQSYGVDLALIFTVCYKEMILMAFFEVMKLSLVYRHSSEILGAEVKHKTEMRVSGACNLLSGTCAGFPTYLDLGASNFVRKIGASDRMPGFLVAALMFIFYLSPNSWLGSIPKFVFSGKLLSQGFQWVWKWALLPTFENYFQSHWSELMKEDLGCGDILKQLVVRMASEEFVIIPLISLICWFKGIPGMVSVGILISLAVFVFRLYQLGCLKAEVTGYELRSGIERDSDAMAILDRDGELVRILLLRSFIFFGTAHKLYRNVRRIFHYDTYTAGFKGGQKDHKAEKQRQLPVPHYLVLDCTNVSGVDTAAVKIFHQVAGICSEKHCVLILAGLNSKVQATLVRSGLVAEESRYLIYSEDLDHALEDAEEGLLARKQSTAYQIGEGFSACLRRIQRNYGHDTSGLENLSQYTVAMNIQKNAELEMKTKDNKPSGLFFLESGFVVVQRNFAEENQATIRSRHRELKFRREDVRLRARTSRDTRFGPGWIIGCLEMASGQAGFALYKAAEDCKVHFLPASTYEELKKIDPGVAVNLMELVARLVAYRVDTLKEQLSHMTILGCVS